MRVEVVDVTPKTRDAFVEYVVEHGPEHDDSFTTAEDLLGFDPAHEPAALALDAAGSVVGAASVMWEGYVEKSSARFRVLHAIDFIAYPLLIEQVLSRLSGATKRVFAFLPATDGYAVQAATTAGFSTTRRSFVLENRAPSAAPLLDPPVGVTVGPASPLTAGMWAEVVNAAFMDFPCRHFMSVEQARVLLPRSRVIGEGTLIARRIGVPAGVVLTVSHPDEATLAQIETLGVVPTEQGRGLGRMLLGRALRAAADAGATWVRLATMPVDEPMIELFIGMGFQVVQTRDCWELDRTR
ncbi:MAG: GNAT family N-acetyltransferase [Coriobacteriia bacterium]|nr:GNAT family N-acetyltransferase [Coriobacteriia bacterium]